MSFTCKGCGDRHPGCHGKCEKYLMEKAMHDAQNEAIREKKTISYGITAQRTAGVTKALRSRRHKIGRNCDPK